MIAFNLIDILLKNFHLLHVELSRKDRFHKNGWLHHIYNMVEYILNSTNSLKLNFIFNDIKYISEWVKCI